MKTIKLNDSGILFDAESHTYCTKEGEILNGITGRLKERAFPDEYKDVPEDVLQRAAMRGTRIHNILELYDEVALITDECQELQNYMKAQTEFPFLANHLQSEYLITDYEKYASAIDKVYVEDDGVILGDVKTTYHLNEEYVSWQLSIYAYFFNLINPDVEVKNSMLFGSGKINTRLWKCNGNQSKMSRSYFTLKKRCQSPPLMKR